MMETLLEMAQRHVNEGAERISRQQTLIAELERDGHTTMLPQARAILAEFKEHQLLSEEHLAREVAKENK